MALYALMGGLGATVGPLGGAWLYQTQGPGTPFYVNGIILAVCAVVLWALLEEPVKRTPTRAADVRGADATHRGTGLESVSRYPWYCWLARL